MTAARAGAEYLDRDQFEALVIGSGFGGAVTVCRLAQAGVDVAVVERGRRWPPGSFPRDLSRLDDGWLWLCNQGLYDARPLNDILAVQAAGWGGGSLVYANVAMRPPQEVFDRSWPQPYSRAALEPYYDLVAHMLDVRPVTTDRRTGQLPPKTRLMARAAALLGQSDGFFHPNLAVRFEDEGPNRFGVTQGVCRRPAMASWPPSTALAERSTAQPPSGTSWPASTSRSGPGCTPARSSCATARSAASRSISRPGSWPRPNPGRSSPPGRSTIWSSAPTSPWTTSGHAR